VTRGPGATPVSAISLALTLVAAGCAHEATVDRSYEGHVVAGRFIEPETYAAFLRGAIAEAAGDAGEALTAYSRAERLDPGRPEIWTRIGAVRCAANPRDAGADAAFERALAVDDADATVWAEKAKCARIRGDEIGARAAAGRASRASLGASPSRLARPDLGESDEAKEDSLVAFTVAAHLPHAALRALVAWGESHGEIALWARALVALARIAPLERDEVAQSAEALAGLGAVGPARLVAAAAVDASEQPLSSRYPLAARLAVDEAVARRDPQGVRERATRAHLALDEVAARALLAGDAAMARELASTLVRADPRDDGARVVIAAVEGSAAPMRTRNRGAAGGQVSGAAWIALAATRVHARSSERAQVFAGIDHQAIVAGDELVERPAAELASRGLVDPTELSADAGIELRVLRGGLPGEGWALPPPGAVDARHEYLALALAQPSAGRTRELGERLTHLNPDDRIVVVARSLVLLASGAPIPPATAQTLLARDSADPLIAAAALRVAEKTGEFDIAKRARAALTALVEGHFGAVTE
jgi:tetratricopeptide (TPR) repeat protein